MRQRILLPHAGYATEVRKGRGRPRKIDEKTAVVKSLTGGEASSTATTSDDA